MRRFKSLFIGIMLASVLALLAFPLAVSAAPAGATGLTAAIVATSGQTISGTVNAAGFDIGIYIGPGVNNVTVNGAPVSGANNEGILVQDSSNDIIENSTIQNNATDLGTYKWGTATPALTEDKAIVLAGTTNCQVKKQYCSR